MFSLGRSKPGRAAFYKVYSPFWRMRSGTACGRRRREHPTSPSPHRIAGRRPRNRRMRTSGGHGPGARRGGRGSHLTLRRARRPGRARVIHARPSGRYAEAATVVTRTEPRSCRKPRLGRGRDTECWRRGCAPGEEARRGRRPSEGNFVWLRVRLSPRLGTRRGITPPTGARKWDAFPWNEDEAPRRGDRRWKRAGRAWPSSMRAARDVCHGGCTTAPGIIVARHYLSKTSCCHWRSVCGLGFAEHLVDWDPGLERHGLAMVAGIGPRRDPYFRVFNPETQVEKFDPVRTNTCGALRSAKGRATRQVRR